MFVDLFSWLDASPVHYWVIAWSAFGLTAALAVTAACWPRARAWWQSSVSFSVAMLIVLLAFRWPSLLDNRQYPDPDESQFIAEASTLRHDPVFWRSVDGSTHGPLTDLPLLAATFVRQQLDFTTARAVSTLLIWIELIGALIIFRHLYKSIAALAVLPLLAVHAFTDLWSFVAYCSEHVPNVLFALGCCALFLAWKSSGDGPPSLTRLFVAGVCFGAIPFAKLQGAPITAIGVAAGIWFLLRDGSLSLSQRRRSLLWLIGGAVRIS